MKKTRKFLAVLLSAVTAFSAMTAFSVSAESTEKMYTLNELMQMSDEEFLTLEHSNIEGGAQGVYNYIDKHSRGEYLITIESEYYNKIGGYFRLDTLRSEDYKANITENEIKTLLVDSPMEYSQTSPININSEAYYWWYYRITIPELGDATYGIDNLLEATDENVMKAAKTLYCLKQVCTEFNWTPDVPVVAGVSEQPETGDVNLDRAVDLYDAIWIASDLVDIFDFTEGQQAIGDVNADEACDLYDAIEIAKTLM